LLYQINAGGVDANPTKNNPGLAAFA
jgi:hypothetical protein